MYISQNDIQRARALYMQDADSWTEEEVAFMQEALDKVGQNTLEQLIAQANTIASGQSRTSAN